MGPKIFRIHGNVGHSFTPQLHGYELGPIIKPRCPTEHQLDYSSTNWIEIMTSSLMSLQIEELKLFWRFVVDNF